MCEKFSRVWEGTNLKTPVCSNSKRLSTALCTIQTKTKSQIDYQMKFRNLSVLEFNFVYFEFSNMLMFKKLSVARISQMKKITNVCFSFLSVFLNSILALCTIVMVILPYLKRYFLGLT